MVKLPIFTYFLMLNKDIKDIDVHNYHQLTALFCTFITLLNQIIMSFLHFACNFFIEMSVYINELLELEDTMKNDILFFATISGIIYYLLTIVIQ